MSDPRTVIATVHAPGVHGGRSPRFHGCAAGAGWLGGRFQLGWKFGTGLRVPNTPARSAGVMDRAKRPHMGPRVSRRGPERHAGQQGGRKGKPMRGPVLGW